MSSPALPRLAQAIERLTHWPVGTCRGWSQGRCYLVSKTCFAQGRAIKLVAHELGGPDYVSLNLYSVSRGPIMKPCEMPLAKVVGFLGDLVGQQPGQTGLDSP